MFFSAASNVNYGIGFKIVNKKFNKDLKDKSSPAFKGLANEIEPEVRCCNCDVVVSAFCLFLLWCRSLHCIGLESHSNLSCLDLDDGYLLFHPSLGTTACLTDVLICPSRVRVFGFYNSKMQNQTINNTLLVLEQRNDFNFCPLSFSAD